MIKDHHNYYNREYFKERDLLLPHLANTIKSFAIKNNLKKILDVGCGTGRLVEFLNSQGFETYGCDNYEESLKLARKLNDRQRIKKASAIKLPYPKSSFDLITCVSVIEHLKVNNSKRFIREAKRILKPKGFIFLVTPNFATPLRIIQGDRWFGYLDPTHVNFYTPNSLSRLLKKNNFKNPQLFFKIDPTKSMDWEFPNIIQKLPMMVKSVLIFLLFSTPLSRIRNSFWVAAQKG